MSEGLLAFGGSNYTEVHLVASQFCLNCNLWTFFIESSLT